MKELEQKLTAGIVWKQLFRFSTPLLFTNLPQAFYSLADMLVVGRFVGSNGLAAVSNASMLSFIINSIGIGIAVGGTVLVAKARGAHDRFAEREACGTSFAVSGIAALLVTTAGLLWYRSVFICLGVPEAALPEACAYMRVICGGTIFVFGYNTICALLRGMGDSLRPLYFIAVATLLNILLDLLLVGVWQCGVAGAAWATVLSQASSLLIACRHLRNRGYKISFRREAVREILKTGIPSALQLVLVNFSFLLVTGLFNRYGVPAAAAAGIGLKLSTFIAMPTWAIGQGVTAMAAQNLGAGLFRRVADTARYGIRLSLAGTVTLACLLQLAADDVMRCFDPDPEVVRLGVIYVRIFCSFSAPAYAAMYVWNAFATGTGAASLALFNALLESVVVRMLLCGLFGIVLGYGYTGVCWGLAMSPFPPMLIGLLYFQRGRWRHSRVWK